MERNYLILTINPGYKTFTIQVNKQDQTNTCYNIDFDYSNEYLILKGFMVPCLNTAVSLSIYGDRETKTMMHCLKVLPRIKDENLTISSFIAGLIKKEKLNHFQININGGMDYSNAHKIDLESIGKMVEEFKRFNISMEF